MNKLGFLLLAAVASKGAMASEVGAPFPQLANSTAVLAVAIAETGASASLAIEPNDEANSTQHQQLDTYTKTALDEISQNFQQRILSDLTNRLGKDFVATTAR